MRTVSVMFPAAPTRPVLPGDTVAVVSPASWDEASRVDQLLDLLRCWGLAVRVGRHAMDRCGYMAGADEDRLADLNDAVRNPKVRAIITTRGGCGSFRLAQGLDVDALRRDPKPLVGFSDITALHQVWHAVGVPSLHGAPSGQHAEDVRVQLMCPEPVEVHPEPGSLTHGLTTTGTARGPVFGGHLEMLSRMVGVVDLDLHGHILLLEATRTVGLGMVDRAMSQLLLSGSLDGLAGLALGRFEGFAGYEDRGWTVLDVLRDYRDRLGVPTLGGLPIGHGQDARTIPLGVMCTLDADRGTLVVDPAVG